MGLTFVRASGQYAEAAGNPLGGGSVSVFTIACWYKPSSIANGTAFGIGDTNSNTYLALGMNGSGNVFMELSGQTATAGTITNGVWTHIAGVQASVVSRIAYKDGAAGSAQIVSTDLTGADTITAGGLMLNGSRLSFAGGSVAHCAVWSSALSGADISSLAAGALPSAVQPGTLVFYSKLLGTGSPEEDLVGALDLVWGAGGAAPAQSADDPPVGGIVYAVAGTSAGTSTSTGDLAVAHSLAGTSVSTSASTAALSLVAGLAGLSAGTSTSTGVLTLAQVLAGVSAGTSTSTGALRVAWALAGVSAGTSSSSGTLFEPAASVGWLEGTSGVLALIE